MNKVLAIIFAAMMALSLAPSAEAGRLLRHLGQIAAQPDAAFQMAQDFGSSDPAQNVAIQPSQAADIAQSVDPSARVIKVKLLPSGVYAVILKGDGKLTRVMVDAQSGNIL